MTDFDTATQNIGELLRLGLLTGAAQMFSWHYEGMLTRGYTDRAEALATWYHAQTA